MPARSTLRTTLLSAAACLALLAGAAPQAAAADVRGEADRIMNLNRIDFVNHPHDPPFDWTNDGCTWWPDGIFFEACAQHDFGYRNYGNHGTLKLSATPETKAWIDEHFWHQMRAACLENHAAGTAQSLCLGEAKVMYDGLRAGVADGAFY
ncbi:phospholipase A2 [Streptomyces sp. NPDC050658]|uniref:phospholipase A2 n=1 Tax=unclassified Streptomyces TaxID=2593676 RepID=UPI00342BDEE0